jgi:signal peptidase II
MDCEQLKDARPNRSRVFLLNHLTKNLPDLYGHLIFWTLSAAGLLLDLWTKKSVFEYLQTRPDNSVPIIKGFFNLVMARNEGAVFGIAQGQYLFLVSVSILAVVVVLAVFLFGGIKSRAYQIALGLLTAGICGNLYDRLFNGGSVRDFIDIVYWQGRHWPAFNIADSLLCMSVGLILLLNFIQKPCQKHAQQQK